MRLFFGADLFSSISDSLVPPISLLPSRLPLTDPGALILDMGVMGGVYRGKLGGAEFVAATLGTLPRVRIGLLVTMPAGVCAIEDCVAIEEVEFDLLGLTGRAVAITGCDGPMVDVDILAGEGAEAVVGVGTGEACAEPETDIASTGC